MLALPCLPQLIQGLCLRWYSKTTVFVAATPEGGYYTWDATREPALQQGELECGHWGLSLFKKAEGA